MRFGERIVVFIFRPIYRTFFERLFWWFLTRVKVFMLAEVQAQLASIEARLATQGSQDRWANVDERLKNAERSNAAQWDALEQLLLALFRSSNVCGSDPVYGENESPVTIVSRDVEKAHVVSNVR